MGGLTKEQRAALMSDQGEGEDPIDLELPSPEPPPPPPTVPTPPPSEPAPASAAPQPDPMAFIKMLTDALTASNRESAQAARNPMPETYLNGGFPEKSVYSHPDGDLAHPRTKLRCPMFMGIYTDKGETVPAFPIFEDVCTEKERVMFNQLVPGVFPVERHDGRIGNWRVVMQSDDLGEPIRLIIAVPLQWLTNENQKQMPGQINFLKQLTGTAA